MHSKLLAKFSYNCSTYPLFTVTLFNWEPAQWLVLVYLHPQAKVFLMLAFKRNVWASDKSLEPGMFWKTCKTLTLFHSLLTCCTTFVFMSMLKSQCLLPKIVTLTLKIQMFLTTPGNQKCLCLWDIIMVGKTRPLKLIMPSRMSSFINRCWPDLTFRPDVQADRCKDDHQMWVIYLTLSNKIAINSWEPLNDKGLKKGKYLILFLTDL